MKTLDRLRLAMLNFIVPKGIVVNPSLTAQFYRTPTNSALLEAGNVTDPYLQNPWVYSAITSIAESASSVPFCIMKATAPVSPTMGRRARFKNALDMTRKKLNPATARKYEDKDAGEPVEGGPWYELFRNPNPDISAMQVWLNTASFDRQRGEACWILEGKTDAPLGENEIPSEIWPIDPRCATEVVDPKTGRIVMWKVRGKNPGNGEDVEIEYPPHMVIMFTTFNPKNRFRGLDPLTSARLGLNQDYKASKYNESFFDNRAEPGGLITTESMLDETQARQVRRAWDDRHKGAAKAFRIAVLHSGMTYQEIKPASHVEMGFQDQKKWNREEVLAVLKVPKMVVGVYEDINNATAQTAYRLFWENAVIPMLRRFEDTLMNRLFIPMTNEQDWGVFDLSGVEALREDLESKSKIAETFQRLGYSRNAINTRLELGFDDEGSGDMEFVPTSLQPVEAIDLTMFETEGAESGQAEPDAEDSPKSDGKPDSNSSSKADTSAIVRKSGARRRLERVYNPGETIVLGKVQKYIFELRSETLRNLERVTTRAAGDPLRPEDVDRILFAQAEWDKKLQETMKPGYKKVMELAWKDAAEELGSGLLFNLQDPRIVSLMGRKLASLIGVNRTMRAKIRSSLIRSLTNGETVAETAKALKRMFNQMSAGQALTIARTETGFAAVGAQALLYQEEGVEWVTWGTAEDEIVRPGGEPASDPKSGQTPNHRICGDSPPVRFMVDVFPNGMHYPLEMGAPAGEVCNCRCSLDAYFPEPGETQ